MSPSPSFHYPDRAAFAADMRAQGAAYRREAAKAHHSSAKKALLIARAEQAEADAYALTRTTLDDASAFCKT